MNSNELSKGIIKQNKTKVNWRQPGTYNARLYLPATGNCLKQYGKAKRNPM